MTSRMLILTLGLPLAALAQPVVVAPIVPVIRVTIAPPRPRVEVRPVAPSPDHMWIDGHWAWRGRRHVWVGGHWMTPPSTGYAWVPARWVNEGGAWIFYEGHWTSGYNPAPEVAYEPPPPPAEPVYVQQAPPPPIVEVRPATPFPGAVWIPGTWQWHGRRHVWVGGHWSAPRPGYEWAPGGWERDGRRHRYSPGHWHH
jgi:hypothetical protein